MAKKHGSVLNTGLLSALVDVQEKPGKSVGNNTRQAISGLIKELIRIYETATGRIEKNNFHHRIASGCSQFRGQFYDFVYFILKNINEKYEQFFPDNLSENPFSFSLPTINPFKIDLTEHSMALGKQIENTLKKINEA